MMVMGMITAFYNACSIVKQLEVSLLESSENVKHLVTVYESLDHTSMDSSSICNELGSIPGDHSPVDFLMTFIRQYSSLNPLIQHCVRTETVCMECTYTKTVDKTEMIF